MRNIFGSTRTELNLQSLFIKNLKITAIRRVLLMTRDWKILLLCAPKKRKAKITITTLMLRDMIYGKIC